MRDAAMWSSGALSATSAMLLTFGESVAGVIYLIAAACAYFVARIYAKANGN